MNIISVKIRTYRLQQGLTQSELAKRANVSLPCVQKIEGGHENPELSTVTALLEALGYSIEIRALPADWNALSTCGAPLTAVGNQYHHHPNSRLLLEELGRALHEISSKQTDSRQTEAIRALLQALEDHYPKFFTRHFGRNKEVRKLLSSPTDGRIVKLRRQALARLATYL